jgi:membrane dipeptidase
MARGATDEQVRLFAGENLLRVWENIEAASQVIQASGAKPDEEIWDRRGWRYGHKSMPFMFAGSREKFAGPAGPHRFSVKANGKHAGLDSQ